MSFPAMVRLLAAFAVGVVLAMTGASRAEARWLRAETAHFVLYSDGTESGLRRFAADLEDFDQLLRTAHGFDLAAPVTRKLDVYLVTGPKELARAMPSATAFVGGVYRANLGDIYAVAIRPQPGAAGGSRILFHEYTHHFMLQHFAAGYPAWLVEGYAEYFGATRIEPDQIEVGLAPKDRAQRLAGMEWMPLADLLSKRPSFNEPKEQTKFYAQSWLLTHYFLSDPGRKAKLADYLMRLGKGEDSVPAMEAALGIDLATLEQQLKTYLRATPAIRYQRSEQAVHDIRITELPPSADALLLEAQWLKSGVPQKDRAEFLQMVRQRAARFPNDRFADLTLARAEITFGDRAAGEAILTRRIEADSRDVDALWLMSLSRIFAGQADKPRRAEFYVQARPFLGKAFALDQNRYQTLYNYAQARSLDADYPTDNTLAVLLKAQELAPQVDVIRVQAARALMKRKRFDEAIALLTPIANNPHDTPSSVVAGRMIEAAKKGQELPPAADEDDTAPAKGS